MATPWMGRDTGLGIGKESTWGTAVSAAKWYPLINVSGGRRRRREVIPHLVAGAAGDRRDQSVQEDMTDLSFEIVSRYTGIGYLIEALMGGTPSTSGTASPYTHTFTLGGTLPSLTCRVIRGNSNSDQLVEGWKANTWALKCQSGDIARISASGIGQTEQTRTNIAAGTYESGEIMRHDHAGTLDFNSANYVCTGFELIGNNQLVRVNELGSLETSEPVAGANVREYVLRATMVSRSDGLFTDHLADVQGDATLALTGLTSPNALTVTMKNATVNNWTDPISSMGFWTQTVELVGHADSSNGSVTLALVNAQANYYD